MGKTREIRKRIKAVNNIRRITRTMQMIATAKFSATLQRATATKPFTEGLFELVRRLASTSDEALHPLMGGATPRDDAKDVTIVVTSDRGLCGPYNGAIVRRAQALFREMPALATGEIDSVGRKGASVLRFVGVEVTRQIPSFGDKPSLDTIEPLVKNYVDRFLAGEVRAVRVVYMRFISAGRQSPSVMQLLPLRAEEQQDQPGDGVAGAKPIYEFSPRAEELLNDLVPAAVRAMMLQALYDAVVSEHIARMVAMKAATDNARKMGRRLTRDYNRARQAQITTELTEIIGGAAALE